MNWKRPKRPWVLLALVLVPLSAISMLGFPGWSFGEEASPAFFTLKSSIDRALRFNTNMLSTREAVAEAQQNKKKQFTSFLPKASARYAYTHLDEDKTFAGYVNNPQDQYRFTATVDQPIFSGFSRLTQYQLSALNLESEMLIQKQTRQDLILQVKKAYFELLQNEKREMVSAQAVKQLEAHLRVAKDFYDVGMIPRNDVLEAEVELANARQVLVTASHDVLISKSRFNTLLRRPVEAPLEVEDVLTYQPFSFSYEKAVENAAKLRTELQLADMDVASAEKNIDLSKKEYYPSLDFQANYYRAGVDPDLDGGEGIFNRDEWDMTAVLSWTFWEWGKARYGVNESRSRLEQAKLAKTGLEDRIRHEVKEAYLRLKGAENNILTAEKAVEQAVENFRISEERYKEQVATSTDVLDAQTLLTRTRNNFFNALSGFNIAKAALDRAMGIETIK